MAQEGSPPQVRGKRSLRAETTVLHEDHPRRCGENFVPSLAHCGQVGSPPQVRGKLLGQSVLPDQRRITPAGAGKTRRQPKNCHLRQDHPRRCGENHVEKNKKLQQLGSPPQVRGKPAEIRHRRHSRRITPAGAGKTICNRLLFRSQKDHPRRCGENYRYPTFDRALHGSPPQVRGKLNAADI